MLGILMWANVWFVICRRSKWSWRRLQVNAGGSALPRRPRVTGAGFTSRTNTCSDPDAVFRAPLRIFRCSPTHETAKYSMLVVLLC